MLVFVLLVLVVVCVVCVVCVLVLVGLVVGDVVVVVVGGWVVVVFWKATGSPLFIVKVAGAGVTAGWLQSVATGVKF